MSIDRFLDRMPGPRYNCFDFVREVWLTLCGEDITVKLTGLLGAFSDRKATVAGMKAFRRLEKPTSPCFVVMQRFRSVPHLGLFLDGRILHLTNRGVQFQPLVVARAYFTGVKYYQ